MLHRFLTVIRGLFQRPRVARELDEELEFHLEMASRANLARGMSPAEARRQALVALGGVDRAKESVRDVRAMWIEPVWQDVRFAWRTLRRSPSYSVAALLTLAIGVGATTAVFSVADAVALRPLPYHRPDRLYAMHSRTASGDATSTGVTSQDFLEWRERQKVFDALGAVGGGAYRLIEGEPEELRGARLTGEVFAALGARPLLGRVFGREHEVEGNHRVVVLGHGFWQRRFGGARDIVGRRLVLDTGPYEVIGVMPPDFKFPPVGRPDDIWVPITFDADDRAGAGVSPILAVVARLKDGVGPAHATAQLEPLSARLARENPKRSWRPVLLTLQQAWVGRTRPWMLLLLGAAGFVLLVACANVAHLTLAHGSSRIRELAIRSALGGGRLRLVRQLLTESLLLSGLATTIGLALAWAGVRLLGSAVPTSLRRIADIAVDVRVLAFAVAAAVTTGVVCGLLPAIQGARVDVVESLKDGAPGSSAGRKGRRMREALALAEVALSFVLLAGASLFILSFARLMSVDPGFDTTNVVTLQVSVPRELQTERAFNTQAELLDRIRDIPGVARAGIISGGWMFGGGRTMFPAHAPGTERPAGEGSMGDIVWIGPGFFQALGVPFIRGRDFDERDATEAPPVMLVNQTAARRYWPNADPIGQRLVIRGGTYEVVGIVGDIAHLGSDPRPRAELYVPLARQGWPGGSFVVRTTRAPADIIPALREAVRSVWPHQPISRLATLDEDIARAAAPRRFNMLLMTVFGVLALVIAVSGLNGVMACTVAQRTAEMGIRTALGARPAELVRLVLCRSLLIVAAGLAMGTAGAWVLARLVQGYLFEVRAHDPMVLAGVGLLLALVALGACWPPARNAARVDPIVTLKAG